jgi:hypothetical protein
VAEKDVHPSSAPRLFVVDKWGSENQLGARGGGGESARGVSNLLARTATGQEFHDGVLVKTSVTSPPQNFLGEWSKFEGSRPASRQGNAMNALAHLGRVEQPSASHRSRCYDSLERSLRQVRHSSAY